MAQQHKVVLLDDLDGGRADHTVAFSLDGQWYEIDLSTHNIGRLQETLAPFIAHARKTRDGSGARRRVPETRMSHRAPEPIPVPTPPAADIPEPVSPTTDEQPQSVNGATSSTATTARPQVPAALFSSPTEYIASRPAAPPKPQAAGLFSIGS
jgi:Lsr2